MHSSRDDLPPIIIPSKMGLLEFNEFYIAPAYNEIIQNGGKVFHYPVAEMYGLGTPEDLQYFLQNSKKSNLIFE